MAPRACRSGFDGIGNLPERGDLVEVHATSVAGVSVAGVRSSRGQV